MFPCEKKDEDLLPDNRQTSALLGNVQPRNEPAMEHKERRATQGIREGERGANDSEMSLWDS